MRIRDRRSGFLFASSRRGPTLTEEAWDALLRDRQPETLRWLATLACLDTSELRSHQVAVALFENPVLSDHTMALSRDREAMRRLSDQLKRQRAKRSSGSAS